MFRILFWYFYQGFFSSLDLFDSIDRLLSDSRSVQSLCLLEKLDLDVPIFLLFLQVFGLYLSACFWGHINSREDRQQLGLHDLCSMRQSLQFVEVVARLPRIIVLKADVLFKVGISVIFFYLTLLKTLVPDLMLQVPEHQISPFIELWLLGETNLRFFSPSYG